MARKIEWTEEANAAATFLCGMPQYGNTTLDRDDLRSLLYNTGGFLLAQGRLWITGQGTECGQPVFDVLLDNGAKHWGYAHQFNAIGESL
jgi:hypothetical protein